MLQMNGYAFPNIKKTYKFWRTWIDHGATDLFLPFQWNEQNIN